MLEMLLSLLNLLEPVLEATYQQPVDKVIHSVRAARSRLLGPGLFIGFQTARSPLLNRLPGMIDSRFISLRLCNDAATRARQERALIRCMEACVSYQSLMVPAYSAASGSPANAAHEFVGVRYPESAGTLRRGGEVSLGLRTAFSLPSQ